MSEVEKRKTKSYTEEFRMSSAKLALESDQSICQIARELGINDSTLHTWIAKYFPNHRQKEVASEDEKDKEIKRLLKENVRLKQERDILKKAAAYFAGEMA